MTLTAEYYDDDGDWSDLGTITYKDAEDDADVTAFSEDGYVEWDLAERLGTARVRPVDTRLLDAPEVERHA